MCAVPFQPLKSREKVLLLSKDGLQARSPLLVKSWAQGRNIHHSYINARLLLQLLVQPIIIAESCHTQLLQGDDLDQEAHSREERADAPPLAMLRLLRFLCLQVPLLARIWPVIRCRTPYYSCSHHYHIVHLLLHTDLLYA